eukprot:TRINITY_DN74926_c0_g1_i1.p1 TRINITY_DN74926_c0_g1~~TRINITY_DN74926_c0_g1_i1.p1  ORF type:complete len:286 (-),score=36.64 TRINITY_DN74926_c0_g1_i1:319-1176(-)
MDSGAAAHLGLRPRLHCGGKGMTSDESMASWPLSELPARSRTETSGRRDQPFEPQVIYERASNGKRGGKGKKRPRDFDGQVAASSSSAASRSELVRCFPVVEAFLEAKSVECRKVKVVRSFLHIHRELSKAESSCKQKSTKQAPESEVVQAWESYLDANEFRDGFQLIQSFLWRCGDEHVLACVPYPRRVNAARLAEALKSAVDLVTPCKLKEVQKITTLPMFVCLPFGLPREVGKSETQIVVDDSVRKLPAHIEFVFDCGAVALVMKSSEFWRSLQVTVARICD